MVRYEGAALILAAFVMDMIHGANRRERIWAFVHSALAGIPLALWILATILTWEEGTSHYLSVLFSKDYAKGLAQSVENRTGLGLHMRLLWTVGFKPLLALVTEVKLMLPGLTSAEKRAMMQSIQPFANFGRVIATVSFAFGAVYGLLKRKWNILALLIFFVPYFVLHARYPYPLQRFHSSVFWIALLLSWFGLQSVWQLVDGPGRAPRPVVLLLQVLVVMITAVWAVPLFPHLAKVGRMSTASTSVPYVAMGLAAVIFSGRFWIYRSRHFLRELSILSVACLIIVSNQFSLVGLVGNGDREKEFKDLAQWYTAKTEPGEKMAVYMHGIVKIFAPERADDLVPFPKADSPAGLVQALYERDVTYVVWATREGLTRQHTRYNKLKLHKNIGHLQRPRDVGPYKFITRLGSKWGYVHVFRLVRPGEVTNRAPADS
jgi:hypothetical protein